MMLNSLPPSLLILPMAAMMLLAMIVAGVMLRRRIAVFKANKVRLQSVALSADLANVVEDSRAADNFRNQFETPVLFYAACLAAMVANFVTPLMLLLAWLFVAARYVHAWIHVTNNRVRNRFYAFVTACTSLSLMWLVLVIQVLLKGGV
jgi:hypothetical protein